MNFLQQRTLWSPPDELRDLVTIDICGHYRRVPIGSERPPLDA